MVDAIVATGATIVDMDFFEALGHKHYQANEIPDDDTLRSLYIDRIYDTYIDEEQLQDCDHTIGEIADSWSRALFSRAFIREMGKWLIEGNGKKGTAWSSSPTSMTCRSSARPSSTARPASAWSSTRSTR
jgi:deoxyhypusine synthase